jgi:AcrR family transcriptional regulator
MSDALEEGLPRSVAITWGMIADPQRGPKRELSHERIVEAAVSIADAEGLGAVTMSKVAGALGFTTMALYRYVSSKDDLLQLMQDAVAGEVLDGPDPTLPDRTPAGAAGAGSETPWQDELRRWARRIRAVYRDHPWLAEIPVSVAQLLTPNNLAVVDQAMRAMRSLTITDEEKTGVLLLITTFIRADSTMQRDLSREQDGVVPGSGLAPILRELVTEERFPYLAPLVESGAYLAGPTGTDDVEQEFDFGLRLILDGVAGYAAQRSGSGSAPAATADHHDRDDQYAAALELDHVRKDTKVREAVRLRREQEAKLREARKREREMIKNAMERGPRKG